ncbi:hypothetical protein K1719_010813 [Acacia pycnantha]|nr:hypothetical protein K1719_010813 [Acacia pycnantha]
MAFPFPLLDGSYLDLIKERLIPSQSAGSQLCLDKLPRASLKNWVILLQLANVCVLICCPGFHRTFGEKEHGPLVKRALPPFCWLANNVTCRYELLKRYAGKLCLVG